MYLDDSLVKCSRIWQRRFWFEGAAFWILIAFVGHNGQDRHPEEGHGRNKHYPVMGRDDGKVQERYRHPQAPVFEEQSILPNVLDVLLQSLAFGISIYQRLNEVGRR
mmetsp:Transcript_10372/g.20882  ORF Transcript_10372/g.20882 Transcript_10372/m.20882 type:complete len:107 (-) Transcript_10372:630-950(-)